MVQFLTLWGVAKWQGTGLWSRLSKVRILPPQPIWNHLEPTPIVAEQFFELLSFPQRQKVEELLHQVEVEDGSF